MQRRTKWVVGAIGIVGVAAAGAGLAGASASDDNEPPITGADYDRAAAAALAHTGGGRVTDSEVGDEDSYYEVEVTLPDGSRVDVQLDEDFQVVGSTADEVDPGDDEDD